MISAKEFAEAAARRSKRSVDEVMAALNARGALPGAAPPQPRHLLLRRIAFGGVKRLPSGDVPFTFDWTDLDRGVWGIASHQNLRGKSTIIEVAFWCLRGRPKGLQPSVRSWLNWVQVEFDLDGVRHRVGFTLADEEPQGRLVRLAGPGDQDGVELGHFASDAEFEAVMGDFMMRSFELVELPYRQKFPHDELAQTAKQSWPAFSNALHISGSHKALLGDETMAGLPARLLRIYLGVAYAELTAITAVIEREEKQDHEQRERRTKIDRGADEGDAAEIERQLKEAKEALERLTDPGDAIRAIDAQAGHVRAALADRNRLLGLVAELEAEAENAQRAADKDRSAALRLRHALHAGRYFGGLDPVCCPRCQREIGEDRRHQEIESGACSVCATPRDPSDEEDAQAELEAAEAAANVSDALLREAREDLETARRRLAESTGRLEIEKGRLAQLERASAGLADRQQAALRVAHLEGRLDERRLRQDSRVVAAPPLLAVFKAARKEAEEAMRTEARSLFDELNGELLGLARGLGIVNLEKVTLNTGGAMRVVIGAKESAFSDLTGGEQLRLRLATIIAMLRIGQRRGLGRHPGLILLDSPGGEEMADHDLTELLREVDRLGGELPNLQVIVASARVAHIEAAIAPERRRVASPDAYLW